MNFIPDTIDALTRLYHETGAGGFIAMGIVLAIFALVIVLYRHTGKLIDLGNSWISHDKKSSAEIIDKLDTIAKSNQDIVAGTSIVAERMNKIPSDPCPLKGKHDDIIRAAQVILEANGKHATDAEVQTVLTKLGKLT